MPDPDKPAPQPESTTAEPGRDHSGGTGTPVVIKVAAVLLVVVALAALVMGIAVAISTVPSHPIVGIGTGLFLVAYGVGLGFVARGLWRSRPWSRGPAVASQVIHLPVAWSFLGGHTQLIGIAIAALALAIIGCLVSPPATRAITRG